MTNKHQDTNNPTPIPRWIAAVLVLVALGFVLALTSCATIRVRQQCRPQCEHLRGPVWTLVGPTIPGKAWDECMSACELGEEAPAWPTPP